MESTAVSGDEDAEIVAQFKTYDDYLNSFVTDTDLFYLEDENVARRIVELGYIHGNGEILKRSEFENKKGALAKYRQSLEDTAPNPFLGSEMTLDDCPLLKAIIDREPALRQGSLATIIFIRDFNKKGQEVSGYIDVGFRLATDAPGMQAVLQKSRRFLPQPTDLSYFNWDTNTVTGCSNDNFEVQVDAKDGLLFKSTHDRKVVVVDPQAQSPGDYSTRIELETTECIQAIIFDHFIGKQA